MSTFPSPLPPLAFIGGGNMAAAIIGGLCRDGAEPTQIFVVEPQAQQADALRSRFGVRVSHAPVGDLEAAQIVVWAVKPQTFRAAADAAHPFVGQALHLSVAAGIRSQTIANWLHSERVVRCMPNTPALVGRGMTAIYARPGVDPSGREWVERILATTGRHLWVQEEAHLDAVTALSGSGPAYVFYFLEAMRQAGVEMGLPANTAYDLAVGTFDGAAALAAASTEPPELLRERVTSKGGTTYAALSHMEAQGIKARFVEALHAAQRRAVELGDEFGRDR